MVIITIDGKEPCANLLCSFSRHIKKCLHIICRIETIIMYLNVYCRRLLIEICTNHRVGVIFRVFYPTDCEVYIILLLNRFFIDKRA